MANYKELSELVICGDEPEVKKVVQDLIDAGENPLDIINEGLMAGMNVVGERFKNGDMFVPEVLMTARAMGSGIDLVKPLLNDGDMPNIGTVVIGTVEGDIHDIGKNLVAMMLESSGFKVENIGVDVNADTFIEKIKETNANILCMSALLTTTMSNMKDVIDALVKEGLREKVTVMVGGAPITKQFADEIGADIYTTDASTAAEAAKQVVSA